MPQHPEAIVEGKRRPFTGAEFLELLRDGREVYIYGERVKDVTTHPAFRNAAVSVAKLYDALTRPNPGDVSRRKRTPVPAAIRIDSSRRPARATSDQAARRHRRLGPHNLWLAGHSPDYKAAFINTLGANAEFTASSPTMRAPGTSEARRRCCFSITRWSIRRSTVISRSRGQGRLHHHPERDRCRHLRFRRQGRGHQLGAHQLQFSRPEHGWRSPTRAWW